MTVEQALEIGLQHQQAGRLPEAAEIYRRILQTAPEDPNALNLLGMVAHESGRDDEAAELVSRAVARAPSVAGFHQNLGNIYTAQRKLDDAIKRYRRAIAIEPYYCEAHNALGVALLGQGRIPEASASFARAIDLRLDYAPARNNLGNALRARRMLKEAAACYHDALTIDAKYYEARNNLAITLLAMGQLDGAAAEARQAIGIRPDRAEAYMTLGLTMEESGRAAEAIECYRGALKLRPESVNLRFQLAALSGEGGFDAAPPDYVAGLFDRYANTFDQHLVGTLKYKAPEMLLDAVKAAHPTPPLDIADLGCGTGLCGVLFKPMARTLLGVDLSAHMIGASRERGVYDQLLVEELVAFLRGHHQRFDLALAADVLNYFGDLRPVFSAARRALRDAGLFALTLERHDGKGFVLNPTRRFAHSIQYVRELATECGFVVASAECMPLRTQHHHDVSGWVIVLRI